MRIIERIGSPEGVAQKYLQRTADGLVVETTYIRRPDEKHIICLSTQIGCVIGCRFCASGLRAQPTKFQRSLSAAEMIFQCLNVTAEMDFAAHPQPLLFSFMGEGEPFLNFEECVQAFQILARITWAVPARLAVSTSAPRPDLIRRLGEIRFPAPLKLQVSIHGPNDEVRSKIIPVAKPLAEIVPAVFAYRERCVAEPDRTIEWNYVLCQDVNDAPEHALALAALLGPGWHIKLNRLNLVPESPFVRTSRGRTRRFGEILEAHGLSTEYYETDESEVASGCGQLSYGFDNGLIVPRSP